jgi:hypothetical protein
MIGEPKPREDLAGGGLGASGVQLVEAVVDGLQTLVVGAGSLE